MFKILSLFMILLLTKSTTHIIIPAVNDSQIPINSIIFINDKLDHYLLIKYQDKYDLIIVSPTKSDLSKVKKITTKIDKIYLYQNQIVDISYNKKYLLNKNQIIDNIEYKNQILTISINNQKFCLYKRSSSTVSCNFVYIEDNNKDIFIKLNDKIDVLFFHLQKHFSNLFIEEIYSNWLDTYSLTDNNYTILTLQDTYAIFNIKIP
ncbi:MAG: hypothetical protein ACI4VR_00635 [Bacilli bacterium]